MAARPRRRGMVHLVRLFLALWLAVFTVQATDLLAVVAPDRCAESTDASAPDDCRDGCLRCICCARVPVFVAQNPAPATSPGFVIAEAIVPERPIADPASRAIYHVPRAPLA